MNDIYVKIKLNDLANLKMKEDCLAYIKQKNKGLEEEIEQLKKTIHDLKQESGETK